jgi:hypothetical protein
MSWGMKLEGTYNFDFLKEPPGKQAMRLIGETVKSRIQVETQDLSKDKNGRRFKPYSKLYAKVRKAAGRGTKVDMTDTGNMFEALQPTGETANSVTLASKPGGHSTPSLQHRSAGQASDQARDQGATRAQPEVESRDRYFLGIRKRYRARRHAIRTGCALGLVWDLRTASAASRSCGALSISFKRYLTTA